MKPHIVAIIPARHGSTRLPGKPLIPLAGKPMVLHVVERANQARLVDRVIVATDDERVVDIVVAAGFEAQMTSTQHRTGTDRLAEVAARLEADIIVNVQGDEPLLAPDTIDAAIGPLLEDAEVLVATTCEPITCIEDVINPSVVKVVRDSMGFALYFSRSPIPFPRDEVLTRGSLGTALSTRPELFKLFAKHSGLYAFRRDSLIRFSSLPSSELERTESLEQLRLLENGLRIKVVPVHHRSIGIDTFEDLEQVRFLFSRSE
jgi:3-deoxy-manno-octulosonate cytidylyltransferase (CMP-KDO synthetase)